MKNKLIRKSQLNRQKKWEVKLKDWSQNQIVISNLLRNYKVI